MSGDRGRLGLLVALCSLAGVVVGFGLSNMATMRVHHCSSARVVSTQMAAAVETPTWLGVRVTTDRADGGAYVRAVEPGSPAARAGIQRGDVITGVSRSHCGRSVRSIDTAQALVRTVRSRDVGDRVRIRVRRGGEEHAVRAQLAQMPVPLFLQEIR
ncbi:MAG: hypothetical protein Tsb0020_12300 [Haliangiales bacterium]